MTEDERRKIEKSRARRAKKARRDLEKARRALSENDELTDWEAEFAASVVERLDKYDAAFRDPEKGGIGEALSGRQKQVLAAMRRKQRDKAKQAPQPKKKGGFRRSSFKNKSGFTPRVRQIDEDFGSQDTTGNDCSAGATTAKEPPARTPFRPVIIKGGKK